MFSAYTSHADTRHCGVLRIRLIPQDTRALHLIVFQRPARNTLYQRAVKHHLLFEKGSDTHA